MNAKDKWLKCKRPFSRLLTLGIILVIFMLVGCGPSAAELAAVDYTPQPIDDWDVSTPAAEGWDPAVIARLYADAARLETVYGLLVVTNEKLIAEKYYNEGAIDRKSNIQSASKSYVSALVGLALEQGCLTTLDQPFLDFFPEYADQIEDSRKEAITIRHLLQMRAGYPWEESHPDLWAGLLTGDFLSMMVHYPLVSDPGTAFHYSNVSSHYLGAIVERACGIPLRTFAEENLFAPLGAELGDWWHTELDDGYPMGSCCIHVTPRDAAKFGLLYLNDGVFHGRQVVPAAWVHDSLQTYSENAWEDLGQYHDLGYGYQWWSAQAGDYHVNFAWGHGGQQIVLLDAYDTVIVLLADPHFLEHNDDAWRDEKANLKLVADFIASLPQR